MVSVKEIESGKYRTTNWWATIAGQNPIIELSKISSKSNIPAGEVNSIKDFTGADYITEIRAQSTYVNSTILDWKNVIGGATNLQYTRLECVVSEQTYGLYLAFGVYIENKNLPVASLAANNIWPNHFYVSLLNNNAPIHTIERQFDVVINPPLPAKTPRYIPFHYKLEDPTLQVADVHAVRFSLWEYMGLATY